MHFPNTKNDQPRKSIINHAVYGVFMLGLISLSVPEKASAQQGGGLIVAPTRVVFEGRSRSAQVTLANKGSKSATYRITVKNLRMTAVGKYEDVKETLEGEKFADGLFRYSPRRVVLKPGTSQAVRILLRKKKGLKPGEYRSHLVFQTVPETGGQSIETPKGKGVIVNLIPVFGISIPLIVRHGKLTSTTSLTNLVFHPANRKQKIPTIKFQINRTGNSSTFGDLFASFTPSSGKEIVLSRVNRLSVYVPNSHRIVTMALHAPTGVELSKGILKVAYSNPPKAGGKLLSESSIKIP